MKDEKVYSKQKHKEKSIKRFTVKKKIQNKKKKS